MSFTAEMIRIGHDANSAMRVARKRRVLALIRSGYGKVTHRMLVRRTGFGERSMYRYLRELREDGLVQRTDKAHLPVRWTVTEAGRAELGT